MSHICRLTLRHPLRKKNANEGVIRHNQGEAVEFFLNRTSLTPPLSFLMRIFWKIPILALPDFTFQLIFC